LPIPPSGHPDHHSDGNDCLHRRLSPSSEVDSKSSNGQTRRRIAVAVCANLMATCSVRDNDPLIHHSASDAASAKLNAAEIQAMAWAARIAGALERHRIYAPS
jgi:hypothetical protein